MARPDLTVEFRPGAAPLDPGGSGLVLSGQRLDYASTPDDAALDITGDIDVRADVSLAPLEWFRAADGFIFASKFSSPTQQSWALYLNPDGLLGFGWSTVGNEFANQFPSTVPVTVPASGRLAVRATLDVDNGAGGRTVTFYTSDSMDGIWTQLGSTRVSAGTTSIFSGTAPVEAGSADGGQFIGLARPFPGIIHELQVLNGINGTAAANPNFAAQATGTTSFADGAGRTWTLHGDASIFAEVPWVDITSRVDSAEWTVGRQRDDQDFPPGQATIVLRNNDRLFDPEYTAGTYFGDLLPRVPFRVRAEGPNTVMSLVGAATGSAGSASTPDAAALDITGDIDVRGEVAVEDVDPLRSTVLASKYLTTGDNRSWIVRLLSSGLLEFRWSTDGTLASINSNVAASTLAPSWDDSGHRAWRVTLDVDDGSTQHVVTFYTAPTIDGPWVQLGETATTAGTTSVFAGTGALEVGTGNGGTFVFTGGASFTGRYYAFELRDGIDGTLVANPDFTIQPPATTSFDDTAGLTWTLSDGTDGSASVGLEVFDQFYGFVEDGWEQEYLPPAGSTCTVRLVDLLGVLNGYTLPGVYDDAVLTLNPVGYWPLNAAPDGEEVADLAGTNDGTVNGDVTFSSTEIFRGDGGSAAFDGDGDRIDITRSKLLPDTTDASVVATFSTTTAAEAGSIHPLFAQTDGNGPGFDSVFDLYVDESGDVRLDSTANGLGIAYVGPLVIDGEPHIVFGQFAGIAVDTATLGTTSGPTFHQGGNGVAIGGTPLAQAGHSDNHFVGSIGSVVVFDRGLEAAERQDILAAASSLDGDRSDEQIRWALGRIGVPYHLVHLDEGRAVMGPADTDSVDALTFIRQVAATEQGSFYVDHANGGVLRLKERYTPWLGVRAVSAQAVFSDDPAASPTEVVRVEKGSLKVEPNGVGTIINQATVTWRDGEETAKNEASIERYGPRGRSIDTVASGPALARGIAQWTVALAGEPQTRVVGFGLNPAAAETAFPVAVSTWVLDRVTYRQQPQAVGNATTRQLAIEGITHKVTGREWTVEFFTSTAPQTQQRLFILDDSELDGTDVLAL